MLHFESPFPPHVTPQNCPITSQEFGLPCVLWVSRQPIGCSYNTITWRDNSYRWSVKSMESFGSSLVFVWLTLWHWFGYSLVTGVWTKQMVAFNAFGSQRMSCISESRSTFWYWDYAGGGVSKMQQCQALICLCGTGRWGVCDWSPPARCVTQWHPPMAPADDWQLCGSEFSTGMTGVRGQREGSQGAGTHIGTWEDQQQYLSRAPRFFFFKAREGLHILTFFPLSLFLFRGFGPVFEKKSFWGINT